MTRTDGPAPLRRRGPRPLLMHLAQAGLPSSTGSATASAGSNGGWPSYPPATEAGAALLAGIAAYRRHPQTRTLPDPPALWGAGSSRLLDYGGTGPATLFVPSLVNRATVLDLLPDHSLLRWLAGHGVRPLLLDWGWPEAEERGFDLTGYLTQRLDPALDAATQATGPVILAGYCMGGLLALAAAQRRPDAVRGLALLAVPWDFHAADQPASAQLAAMLPVLEPVMQATGTLPVDALQAAFAAPDLDGIARKYRDFGRMPQDSARAARFVALEDWLNDGVPLAAPVARECLGAWYGANAPARGAWHAAGTPVDPARLRLPAFVAVPGRDRIVPPAAALPLAALIPDAVLHRSSAGHVGLVAGSRAEAALWRPLRDWAAAL